MGPLVAQAMGQKEEERQRPLMALVPSKTCALACVCMYCSRVCPLAICHLSSMILTHVVVLQALEVETSADSFSSAASGTSVNSGTTMTSTGISGLTMLYHIRVLIPCYKVRHMAIRLQSCFSCLDHSLCCRPAC